MGSDDKPAQGRRWTRRKSDDRAASARAMPASETGDTDSLSVAEIDARAAHILSVLQNGYARLRFPHALELDFRRATFGQRQRQTISCALIGVMVFAYASWSDAKLLPTIAALIPWVNAAVMAFVMVLIAVGLTFRHPDRIWPQELITAIGALAAAAANIWAMAASESFAGATHSFALILIVTYITMAARQRFWYALAVTATILVAFILCAGAHTPLERLVIMHNLMMLGLSSVLALGANYRYEHDQRRSFLFDTLGALRRERLGRTNAQLEELSCTDALTGAGNRRRFDTDIAEAWQAATSSGHTLALLLLDIDHFKSYNDAYGHPQGDECLKRMANLLTDTATQHMARFYRVGGEEFALLLTAASAPQALALADALRTHIHEQALPHGTSPVADRLTISVGVAVHEPRDNSEDTISDLQKRADVALYRSKAGGRNRVTFGSQNDPGGRSYKPRRYYSLNRQKARVALTPHDPAESSLAQAFVAQTKRNWRHLRFTPALESRYQHHRQRRRRYELVVYTLAGLLVFNLYHIFSRRLIYDIPILALNWCAVASGILLTLAILGALPLGTRWREALHLLGLSVFAVGSVIVSSASAAPTASNLAVSAILVALFSVVAGNLTFRATSVLVVSTIAAYGLFIRPTTPDMVLIVRDYIGLMSGVGLFILIASYQLEYGLRRGFVDRWMARHRQAKLESAALRLHTLATSDPLTGIGNRRRFNTDLAHAWKRAQRDRTGLGVLAIDIDEFKQYNDIYGHGAGDSCLCRVASAIDRVAAELGGTAFRVGGEEFALLQSRCSADAIRQTAEHVHAAIAELNIVHAGSHSANHVSVSVGAATSLAGDDIHASDLVAAADRALYDAKSQGRNRCEFEATYVA